MEPLAKGNFPLSLTQSLVPVGSSEMGWPGLTCPQCEWWCPELFPVHSASGDGALWCLATRTAPQGLWAFTSEARGSLPPCHPEGTQCRRRPGTVLGDLGRTLHRPFPQYTFLRLVPCAVPGFPPFPGGSLGSQAASVGTKGHLCTPGCRFNCHHSGHSRG